MNRERSDKMEEEKKEKKEENRQYTEIFPNLFSILIRQATFLYRIPDQKFFEFIHHYLHSLFFDFLFAASFLGS